MSDIFEFPREWYRFVKISFQLRASSQVSARPWAGGNSVYGPHAQIWMPQLTVAQIVGDGWQARSAFFSRLGGQAGLMRISDPARIQPQYNSALLASTERWSDNTLFDDGTGYISGLLPPTVFVGAAQSRGANSIVIGGLPASLVPALQRGDLFEIRPNGIAGTTPHLYEIVVDGPTNSSGRTGVEFRPPLRADVMAGDMVVLSYPSSVFHLIDDTQGSIELSAPNYANFGFSLIEAIEGV